MTLLKSSVVKILIVCNSATLGGASLSLLSLLKRFPTDRLNPTVLLPEDGPLKVELNELGVQTIKCYQPWWVTSGSTDAWLYAMRLLPNAVETLRNIIKNNGIDLVYTNSSVIPAGAFAAALEGKPHIWRLQEFIDGVGLSSPVDPKTIRECILALSSCVMPISEALASDFRPSNANGRLKTVHIGIDYKQFESIHPSTRDGVIVSIGTISKEKGLGDLVEAAGFLSQKGVQFSVKILGNFYYPKYVETLKRRLKGLGVLNRFEFIEYQNDIRPWLAKGAVYCCPSHSEGMSRTILEAMASGLPVVSTDCGGPRDLLVDGVTGELVPVGEPKALAGALAKILTDPQKATKQGEAGRKRAEAKFSIERTIPKFFDVIDGVVNENKPAYEAKPFCEILMTLLSQFGPRLLLGKKWRLAKVLMGNGMG